MKRFIIAGLAVGFLAAGPWAGRAGAEDDSKTGAPAAHRDNDDHNSGLQKLLKEWVGVNDEQAAKLTSTWDAEKAVVKPLREQDRELERKLEEQVRALAPDKEIMVTLDQLDANVKVEEAEYQKVVAVFAATMKPYQRAKLRLMRGSHSLDRSPWEEDDGSGYESHGSPWAGHRGEDHQGGGGRGGNQDGRGN